MSRESVASFVGNPWYLAAMASSLRFEKYEGIGNDFVVVRANRESDVPEALARALCDRHFGVGADGVLLVLPPVTEGAIARMHVVNADGSIAKMCGNGLRCVVRFLLAAEGASLRDRELVVDTASGPYPCRHFANGDVEVGMGRAVVGRDLEIAVAGARYTVIPVDMGNPHAVVVWASADETPDLARTAGPQIEKSGAFPSGVNVEFVAVTSRSQLRVDVWERGVGITLACGTGACAAVAAAVTRRHVEGARPIPVRLPGGLLDVRYEESQVWMRGPARRVFSGEFDLTGSE